MKETTTKKINWVSILQGWSMLLVVIGHAGLSKIPRNPDEPVISLIEYLIYSFHMPLFMMVSGYLFYLTRVKTPVGYCAMLLDKLKRLGIPYIAFTAMTLLLKSIFNEYMVRQTSLSFKEVANAFLYPTNNPLGELWFIATLLLIFVLTPLLKWALRNPLYSLIAGLLAGLVHFFPGSIDLFCLSLVARYVIWFFIGLLISRYKMETWLDTWGSFVFTGIAFILTFCLSHLYGWKEVDFIVTLTGCLFSYSLALKLDKFIPSLFHTFRAYTFQIYLLGIFFQIAFKILYQKMLYPHGYAVAFGLCILLGLYAPVLISLGVRKINNHYLNLMVGMSSQRRLARRTA